MGVDLLPSFIRENYDVHEWRHACAVLSVDHREQWDEMIRVLTDFRFHKRQIEVGGGGRSEVAVTLDNAFREKGWNKKNFDTRITIDGRDIDLRTHEVDCFKEKVALEMEWNNKDPFFQRDLDNFRRLFDLQAVSVGVVVTRADELQGIFDEVEEIKDGERTGKMIGRKYGNSTTHMSKLTPRLYGGSSGGCPVLAFGIKKGLYVAD